jgi:pre-rRNA-processing protein IPI3
MSASSPLAELILSSTHSASPLPTISLHNPITGTLVYSFRSPVASTSTSTGLSTGRGGKKAEQDAEASLGNRRTFAAVEGGRGVGGVLLGLGGKDGRAGVNVWNFTRVRLLLHRFKRVLIETK